MTSEKFKEAWKNATMLGELDICVEMLSIAEMKELYNAMVVVKKYTELTAKDGCLYQTIKFELTKPEVTA